MFCFRHFAASAIVGTAMVVGGCAHERHEDIPLSAAEIGEGKESVFYNAPYDGRVYVYDATRDEMIYNGTLKRGQMVKVDAKDNKILIDNQTAVEKDLVNDHRYKIFFDKDEAATAKETIPAQPQTTIVTPPGARTSVTTDPNAPRTTITTDPNAPRTTITTDPNPPSPQPQTTVQTAPNAGQTTVTTPDAKVTTDPNTGQTTVQPR